MLSNICTIAANTAAYFLNGLPSTKLIWQSAILKKFTLQVYAPLTPPQCWRKSLVRPWQGCLASTLEMRMLDINPMVMTIRQINYVEGWLFEMILSCARQRGIAIGLSIGVEGNKKRLLSTQRHCVSKQCLKWLSQSQTGFWIGPRGTSTPPVCCALWKHLYILWG